MGLKDFQNATFGSNFSEVTSPYGWRTIFGKKQFHVGTDFGTRALKIPIKALYSGKVVKSAFNSLSGNHIEVKYNNDAKHKYFYAHLDKPGLPNGYKFSQGQTLGYVGTTGSSTGVHLHFGVTLLSTGKFINSDEWLRNYTYRPEKKVDRDTHEFISSNGKKYYFKWSGNAEVVADLYANKNKWYKKGTPQYIMKFTKPTQLYTDKYLTVKGGGIAPVGQTVNSHNVNHPYK